MQSFIGRELEIEKLELLYEKKGASIVVVKGRRRVGKSRLVAQFGQGKCFLSFTGLAPVDGASAQKQRDHFSRQLASFLKVPPMTFLDWSDAFIYLAHAIDGSTVILFDEISWMGAGDPTFIPKLKAWWDTLFTNKTHLMLIFCGSVSTWIEKNIINSTAFFGRISLILTVEPFSLLQSAQLLKEVGFKGSSFDIYKILSVMGGIPWYLEKINRSYLADQNIKELCFQKGGLLSTEFDRIFHDLFDSRGTTYEKILKALKNGARTLAEVRKEINFGMSGTLSSLMEHLIISGFVTRYYQWSIKTTSLSKQSLYAICDPYLRFYLKYIEPNKLRIEKGDYDQLELREIPGFDTQMGFQVEHLLLQNRSRLLNAIGISGGDIAFDGPYRQKKSARRQGCQIDYLVQTRTKTLFLCEFKFRRRELGFEVVEEVNEKMKRIALPRGFAIVPILFHIGGVAESLIDRSPFYRIIDIGDFLDS